MIICAFFILSTATVSSESGTAWRNGRKGPAKTITALHGDYFTTHKMATTAQYYSTHDWIAECALDLLYSVYPQHRFIEMLWYNIKDMKMYFLLGTEVPDSILPGGSYQDVSTSIRSITRAELETQIYFTHHTLEFNTDESSPEYGQLIDSRAYLAEGAEKCQQLAEFELGLGDCQAAAFFLGAMCHFIADAVFFPHLRDNRGNLNDPASDELDRTLKWMMHYLTSRKLSDWGYDNGLISGNPPFFDHSDAKSYFTGVRQAKYKYAKQATWWAAYHVWAGKAIESAGPWETLPYRPDAPDIMSAYFLSSSDDPDGWQPEDFPSGFDTEILKQDGVRYDYWFEIPEEWEEDYLKALQFHLNLGVYYCAGVINHVKDSYTKCEDGIEKSLTQTIEILAVEYAFLWAMAGLGQFALFIVIAQTAVSSFSGDKESLLKAFLSFYR